MSRVKERIELMRRTGAAVPPEVQASPPTPASAGGLSSRAQRYGGRGHDFADPKITADEPTADGVPSPAPTRGGAKPQATPTPSTPAPSVVPPRASAPAAASRRDRFAPPRVAAAQPPNAQPSGQALPIGPALAPAPNPGEETEHHQQLLKHCLEMWHRTPGRVCDRELVLHSAAWYERNQPWALAGLHSMVERALDEIGEQRRAVAPTEPPAATAARTQHAASDGAHAQEETGAAQLMRYGRQRG